MVPLTDPLWLFVGIFLLTAFAGLSGFFHQRSKGRFPVTLFASVSTFLWSGMAGLGLALFWYTDYRDNIHRLVGLCVIVGLGGAKIIDAIIEMASKVATSITFKNEKDRT